MAGLLFAILRSLFANQLLVSPIIEN
jgi:hypothetical protein